MDKNIKLICLPLLLVLMGCSRNISKKIISFPDSFETIMIDVSSRGLGPCEPTICIDPSNTSRIIAGSVLDNVYISEDGGRTWSKDQLKSSFGVFGDPVIRIDGEGRAYYAHLSDPSGGGRRQDAWLDRMVIQRSDDGGKTWNNGGHTAVRGSRDQDKEWLYIDPQDGTILISWTEFDKYGSARSEDKSRILFSKSMDKGETWSEPIVISGNEGDCLDGDQTTEGATSVIGTDGTYYIAWAHDNKIYLDYSKDRGVTWQTKDAVVAEQIGGWSFDIPGLDRCNGMPFIKVDRSKGRHHGRLYVHWSDQKNGADNTDLWIIHSDDNGKSWSEPKKINDDTSNHHQFQSNIDVDPVSGTICVIFYDRRAYSDNRTDVYLAYSTDGGASFINKKMNDLPFTPVETNFFGDYTDISAYNNKVRPIWTQYDGRKLSVWTAIIDMEF
jgi:hypothetical protein